MAENFSVHCEIRVTGGRPGRPIAGSGEVSIVTSDISTKSRSRIFFANLGASEAAGLNGPGLARPSSPDMGRAIGRSPEEEDAAAASRSRPVCNPAVGVKVGRSASALVVAWEWESEPQRSAE